MPKDTCMHTHHTRHVIFDWIRGPEIGVLGIIVGLIGYVDRYLSRGPEIGVLGIDRIRGPVFGFRVRVSSMKFFVVVGL